MNAFDRDLDTRAIAVKANLMYDARKLKHKVSSGSLDVYMPHFRLLVKRMIQLIKP